MEKGILQSLLRLFYFVLVVVLAVATWVERANGSVFVRENIYGSGWFVVFCVLFFLLFLNYAIRKRIWKNCSSLLFSLSFALVSVGSVLTFAFSEKGYAHLQKGVPCTTFEMRSGAVRTFPFTLELDSFRVRYYPGTDAPMDYLTYMRADGECVEVSMNRNFTKGGYRFCQSSYDEEGEGSWLSVNYDPYGVPLVFGGYFLFSLAGLSLLFRRGSRFRQLLRHPLLQKSALSLLLILLPYPYAKGAESPDNAISDAESSRLGRTQVVYQGRIVPFNTVALDVVRKIYGRSDYEGYTPEQVTEGWRRSPDFWRHEKMIKVKSSALREVLNMEEIYCSLDDLYDEGGRYRLRSILWREREKLDFGKLEKEAAELDEKVAILTMLTNGTLVKPLPEGVQPLSEAKVTAELLYNRLPLTKILFMLNLTLGIFACVALLGRWTDRRRTFSHCFDVLLSLLPYALILILLAQFFGFSLRWYVSGRLPLNNGFETMQFFSLAVLGVAALLVRRYLFVAPFGLLLSGFALLVAHLGEMNPRITPLVPVLNSPWLSMHVSMIMMSYALFAFLFSNSLWTFLLMRRNMNANLQSQLTVMNHLMLYPAVLLLAVGIALGSVWANESWGQYWGWDPKEVWALVTLLVYAAPLFFQDSPLFHRKRSFHLYLVFAFFAVLMTYFGVNYLLGGLHSYSNP